jgi:hypothetical protein
MRIITATRFWMPTGTLAALTVASLSACGGEQTGAVTQRVSEEPLSPSPSEAPWSEGEGWSVASEPLLEIGVFSGAEEYQLMDVSAGARQADGDIVLADAGSGTVRLYRADGTFAALLGGSGGGPGEFRDPTQIVIDSSDGIAVWDDAAWRVTRFDPDGDFVGVQGFGMGDVAALTQPPFYPASGRLLADEELLVRLVEKEVASKGGKSASVSVQAGGRARDGLLRIAADMSGAELVMELQGEETVIVEAPWGPQPIAPPLARRARIAVQPGVARFCAGDQEEARVTCLDPEGRQVFINWVTDPLPVAEGDPEVQEWRAETEEIYLQKLGRGDVTRFLDLVPVPEFRPPYSALILDTEGNLWVERGPVPGEGAIEFLLFDPSGLLRGPVLVPPVRILEIGDDYVLGVARDEMEVQYVQVLSLVKTVSR